MAYFGTARPETVLEPIDKAKKVEVYTGNGVKLVPGMTVGEYQKEIMQSIYLSVAEDDVKEVKRDEGLSSRVGVAAA